MLIYMINIEHNILWGDHRKPGRYFEKYNFRIVNITRLKIESKTDAV